MERLFKDKEVFNNKYGNTPSYTSKYEKYRKKEILEVVEITAELFKTLEEKFALERDGNSLRLPVSRGDYMEFEVGDFITNKNYTIDKKTLESTYVLNKDLSTNNLSEIVKNYISDKKNETSSIVSNAGKEKVKIISSINRLKENDTVITSDNGINNAESIKNGFIITDHHNSKVELKELEESDNSTNRKRSKGISI